MAGEANKRKMEFKTGLDPIDKKKQIQKNKYYPMYFSRRGNWPRAQNISNSFISCGIHGAAIKGLKAIPEAVSCMVSLPYF